jgi:hypothetical protein
MLNDYYYCYYEMYHMGLFVDVAASVVAAALSLVVRMLLLLWTHSVATAAAAGRRNGTYRKDYSTAA